MKSSKQFFSIMIFILFFACYLSAIDSNFFTFEDEFDEQEIPNSLLTVISVDLKDVTCKEALSVIEKMGNDETLFVKLVDLPGPLGLLRGNFGNDEISLAISIIARYSKARDDKKVRGAFGPTVDTLDGEMTVEKIMEDELETLRF